MAYVDFPADLKGQKDRKAFWLSETGLALIKGWRKNGVTTKKIYSEFVGVSATGWANWFRESAELRDALHTGKEAADLSVEEALYRRATGYDYEERTHELVEGELVLTKIVTKHVAPDVKAILHWLFNRKPGQWRSVQEPLEQTKYTETVKSILVAMKEVAESGTSKEVEVKEGEDADGV